MGEFLFSPAHVTSGAGRQTNYLDPIRIHVFISIVFFSMPWFVSYEPMRLSVEFNDVVEMHMSGFVMPIYLVSETRELIWNEWLVRETRTRAQYI